MKKYISIIMVFLMLIVMAPMAFATGEVTGVTITEGSSVNATVGTSLTLNATVTPDTATDKSVKWSSDNTEVATVGETTGVVTPLKAGDANITVTTNDGSKTATSKVTVTVPVTGVSLNKDTITLKAIAATETLTATVTPDTATNKSVTWESSNSTVATVSNTGVITAAAIGTTIITVKTEDGGYTDTCNVTVFIPATSITVTPETATINLKKGGSNSTTLTATTDPATGPVVSWKSSDETVATVSNGVVTALKTGEVTITASTKKDDGTDISDTAVITVQKDSSATEVEIPTGPSLTYTGAAQTGLADVTGKYTASETVSATNVGNYIAKASLEDGNIWNDGTIEDKSIAWSISPRLVDIPTPSVTKYIYTGSSITPVDDTGKYFEISGTKSAAIIGNYSSVYKLKDNTSVINQKWKDDTTADITYNWTIGYQITFNANGGTVSTTSGVTAGDGKYGTLPTPTRTGYTFSGWYTAQTGGTQVTDSTVFSGNTTVYAHWTSTNYTVYAGKYTGGSYGKAYVSYDSGSTWNEITSTSGTTLGTFTSGTVLYFKMVPYTNYYSHPYVYSNTSGSYYAPTIYNYIFTVTVTDNITVRLNFTTTPPTGDTSVWQYVVAALASTGVGTGTVVALKRKKK